MLLKTQITQTKELDILLPLFYKLDTYGNTNYIAVLNEKTFIKLFISRDGDMVTVLSCVPGATEHRDILTAMKDWTAIKEQEFLSAYDDAISSISLRPQLHEQNFSQDLNVLDLKRTGQ